MAITPFPELPPVWVPSLSNEANQLAYDGWLARFQAHNADQMQQASALSAGQLAGAGTENALDIARLQDTGLTTRANAQNLAEAERLRAQIESQQGMATEAQARELERLQASIASAERIATTGAQSALNVQNAQNAGALGVATTNTTGALNIANANNTAAMQQLQAQIESQQGMATQEQAAEMARLQAQITGTSELTAQQSALQNQTEEARYARAREQTATNTASMDALLQRMGVYEGNGAVSPTGVASQEMTPAEKAAEDAVFARAKDKVGMSNRASMNELDSLASARGLHNSGLKAQLGAQVLAGGAQSLGETARTQATETVARNRQVADRDVAAGLTRRGQNMGMASSMAGLYKSSGGGGVY